MRSGGRVCWSSKFETSLLRLYLQAEFKMSINPVISPLVLQSLSSAEAAAFYVRVVTFSKLALMSGRHEDLQSRLPCLIQLGYKACIASLFCFWLFTNLSELALAISLRICWKCSSFSNITGSFILKDCTKRLLCVTFSSCTR